MKKIYLQILTIVLAFVFIFGAGGVYAAWAYAEGDVESTDANLGIGMYVWTDRPEDNQGDMSFEETTVTNNLTDILTDVLDSGSSSPEAEEFNDIIADRKSDTGGGLFATAPKEVGIDDPDAAGLRRLLGIEDDSELSAIIKFTNDAVGYELYTTRVNVNAKDSNGNYVFADDEVDAKNHYIYPVNKTTFTKKADGTVVADTISVGYSRVIWYYETGGQESSTIRSFDVTLWAKGDSADPVKVLADQNFYIHGDIGQVNADDSAYFIRTNEQYNFFGGGYTYTERAFNGTYAASDVVNYNISKGTSSGGTANALITISLKSGGTVATPTNTRVIEIIRS